MDDEERKRRHAAYMAKYLQAHPEQVEAARKRAREYGRTHKAEAAIRIKKWQIEHGKELKTEVCRRYGPNGELRCSRCDCSELAALTIDHIFGNGGKHRKEIRESLYYWLRREGYPSGYQTLCFNHQRIKQFENGEFGGGRQKVEGGTEKQIRQREAQARYRAANPGIDKQKNEELKKLVCSHYGPSGDARCSWVGCEWNDIRVLSIDHVQGGGSEERRRTAMFGKMFYAQLVERGFPEGFQTLCMNHQWIKEAETVK